MASTARPSAPPTWTLVLTSPEASPESWGVAPDIADLAADAAAVAVMRRYSRDTSQYDERIRAFKLK